MKFEIERKFLLKNDGWKAAVVSASKLSDGLLSSANGCKVRVRTDDTKALVTVKGPKDGRSRTELEYGIPYVEAEYMLSNLCGDNICNKTRYVVRHGTHVWHVDIYEGVLQGFRIAEIELTGLNEKFSLPYWIDQEVTDIPSYSKWAILARAIAARKAEASAFSIEIGSASVTPPARAPKNGEKMPLDNSSSGAGR